MAADGNLAPNGGFEEAEASLLPVGWKLEGKPLAQNDRMHACEGDAYSGNRALTIISTRSKNPNVYYTLFFSFRPELNTAYEIRCMAKGDNREQSVRIVAGSRWFYRFGNFPSTGEWSEVKNTIIPAASDLESNGTYTIRILVEGPTSGYSIDDFSVRKIPDVSAETTN